MPLDRNRSWRHRLASGAVAGLPLAVGGLGSVFTANSLRVWYATLDKPSWNPPSWVFGPVWTALYLAMGVGLLQVWRLDRRRREVRIALGLFAVQLGLNLGWSYVFFARREVGAAFAEILALDVSILATIVAFARLRPAAAALLLPYLGWTAFATALNGEIWRRNH